jgi:hypothetical protein
MMPKMPEGSIMYTIDADKLTIRDAINLQKAGTSGDIEQAMPILRKCVIVDDGRDLEDLPARHLRIIMQELSKRLGADASLGN